MDGIVNVNKPSGPTSFAVVAQLRRLLKERRVGHGGTLDPLASGVLPIFLGKATRLVEYLQEYPKTYRAGIVLGVTTDTYDAQGRVISTADPGDITISTVLAALEHFRGTITQIPPAFSALKRDGQPLYELARQGLVPEVAPRQVFVYRLELINFHSNLVTLEVECSKGTYIRSLANDLGRMLGVGAHLGSLVRTAYGPFDINNAISLEGLTEAGAMGTVCTFVHPLDAVLTSWPMVVLTEEQSEAVRCGRQLALEVGELRRLRAYGTDNRLIALLAPDDETGAWRSIKVFGSALSD